MTVLALIGLVIATYLLVVRLAGEAPVCGPVRGCDVVAASEYATLLGVPVALFGVAFSIVLVGAVTVWWRRADRRALYLAYALGLLGILVVVYLTYLELFVIEAVCVWCATYGVTIVAGWLLAVAGTREGGTALDGRATLDD